MLLNGEDQYFIRLFVCFVLLFYFMCLHDFDFAPGQFDPPPPTPPAPRRNFAQKAQPYYSLSSVLWKSGLLKQLFGTENYTRKNWQYPQRFLKLYQLFMNNFLSQNVPISSLYILLTKRFDTLWCEGINTFWFGSIGTVWYRKSQKKNQQYSPRLPIFHE